MNFVISTIQTLFRHRWLLLIGTTLFTLSVIYYTRHMQGGYKGHSVHRGRFRI